VEPTSRHRHYVGQVGWHINLAVRIIAPCHHSAVSTQRQTVEPTSRHRHHVGQVGWHISLAIKIIAPRHHCAVFTQRHTLQVTSHHGDDIGQAIRLRGEHIQGLLASEWVILNGKAAFDALFTG
jgi:hypothetical protein